MGARLGGVRAGIAGRSRVADNDLVEAHEINVTPFIDVMLVLLIIFMVAARSLPSISASSCLPAPLNRNRVQTSRCSSP